MKRYLWLLPMVMYAGCQEQYYKVSDIPTGQTYYAKSGFGGLYGNGGYVHFKDLQSGDDIVLQSSRVHPVSAEEAARFTASEGATTRATAVSHSN